MTCTLELPSASAVVVYVCPSTTTVTVALASAVPVNVGVVSLVAKSVTVGASGAVASMAKAAVPASEVIPEASVAVTLTV